MIDLEAYFHRIGFTGDAAPDRATLDAIHRLHPQAIAFENLDPLLGVPVRLDLAALEHKLVRSGRGGFCYEHNLLLMHVLKALGFDVYGLGARVLWGAQEGAITARAHMLLCVVLDGKRHIADVGFGGTTPTAPLCLELAGAQRTAHEPFRLVRSGDEFVLQAEVGGSWQSIYRFDLQEQFQPDYEIVNWYQCTSPDSYFTRNLMAARPVPGARYGLRNTELSVHHLDGRSERRVLRTAAELRDTLAGTFGLALANTAGLDALLTRLTAVAA
ncbi:MAG TPA: arylamine N-acetyltransferase [Xanthobacteraceae bacterium]|jgi:N-hydroxyarylamine O-acetyltransferase